MTTLLERIRAQHPDAPIWAAQPRQAAFLKAPEFEVLYGGAAGGGKTDALLVCGLTWISRYPGAQVLFLRRTYPDLSMPGGAIPRSHELFHGHAVWNGSEHKWTFPDGGTLQFGHLEHGTAHLNYRGAQIDLLLWDELTQASLEQYLFLRSRVRATRPGVVTAIRAATNPGDVGHAWVRQRWVDAAPWGEPFHVRTAGAEPVSARFIPARVDDNQRLLERDPGYKDRLAELPDHLRRAYLEGDWDIYEGQYFEEWRQDVHTCKSFDVPPDWTRWLAVDYGFADPFCALFLARAPDTRRTVYVYRELYAPGLRDQQQAELIVKAAKGERLSLAVLDPSMFNERREQEKPSIASVYAGVFRAGGLFGVRGDEQQPLYPASNARIPGWNAVRALLAHDPAAMQKPRLQVMRERCPNLIRTLPAMVRDPLDPEDLADKVKGVKTEDHAVDALRYGAMVEATAPRKQPERVRFGG